MSKLQPNALVFGIKGNDFFKRLFCIIQASNIVEDQAVHKMDIREVGLQCLCAIRMSQGGIIRANAIRVFSQDEIPHGFWIGIFSRQFGRGLFRTSDERRNHQNPTESPNDACQSPVATMHVTIHLKKEMYTDLAD